MSDDLIAFLRARYDEDEAVARAATDGPWETWQGRELHGLGELIHPVRTPGQTVGSRATIVTASWLDAEHIARHDPARILAEVEAKRRFLARYEEVTAAGAASGTYSDVQEEYDWLLNLTWAPYADHPEFDEEWRP